MSTARQVLARVSALLGVRDDVHLAELTGVPPQVVSSWRARNKVPYALLVQMAENHQWSLDYVLAGVGPVTRSSKPACDGRCDLRSVLRKDMLYWLVTGDKNAATLQRLRREEIRSLCLDLADRRRPHAVSESLLLRWVRETYSDLTAEELRRELDYLSRAGMLVIAHDPDAQWVISLTHAGIDHVEGRARYLQSARSDLATLFGRPHRRGA